jgi:taurine dioxygenase
MTQQSFRVVPTDAPLGAEIVGLDLSADVDEATFREIEAVLDAREVIFFRGQRLTPEQHVRFSRHFGEVEVPVNRQYSLPAQPEIYIVSNIVENGRHLGNADAGLVWHTDSSYKKLPSRASLLYAIEVPRSADGQSLGDTCFASMAAAYDALPEGVRQTIDPLVGVHNYMIQYERRLARMRAQGDERADLSADARASVPEVTHPVVMRHPRTGRKGIYVNSAFTTAVVGMEPAEGKALVDNLIVHASQPQFVYRHRWQAGDLLIWDNYATQHRAIQDYALPQRRLMYRTTVQMDKAYA